MIDSGKGGGPGAQGQINGTQREGTNAHLSKSLPLCPVLSFLKVGRSWEKKAVGWEAGGEKRYLQIRLTFLGLCRSPNQACGYFQNTSQIRESDLGRAEINTDRIILRTCTDPTEG